MAAGSQSSDATAGLPETDLMAVVLEGRHGNYAAEVADFFAILHRQQGDPKRSKAWAGVADAVRRRESDRLMDA